MVRFSTETVAAALEAFLRDRFEIASDDFCFNRDTDLWDEGYVDSQGVVEIVEFLENRFGISVSRELLFDPNFVRINGIGKLVTDLVQCRAAEVR